MTRVVEILTIYAIVTLELTKKRSHFQLYHCIFILSIFVSVEIFLFFLSIGRFGFTIVTIELVARHRIVRAPYRNFFLRPLQ